MVTYDTTRLAAAVLKHQTAAQHEALEEVVLPRLQALKTIAAYTHLLTQFYGYFKPVEQRIAQLLTEVDLPDLPQRRNADRILTDLTFSKAHIQHLLLATNLPDIKSKNEAFGALYVLEGSTLGGRGITKMLLKNGCLNLNAHQVHFFTGYGAATGAMWTCFLEHLNARANNAPALQEMVQAANQTFALFKNWLLTSDYGTEA